jgi:ArsR family transcriptional regulator
MHHMEFVQVYKCLCDMTRLRILNLLIDGPLCVCHIYEVLEEPQPKISKQLQMMKEAGILESERCYNWSIYRLIDKQVPVLTENLKCLQDLRTTEEQFRLDLLRREKAIAEFSQTMEETPGLKGALAGNCC